MVRNVLEHYYTLIDGYVGLYEDKSQTENSIRHGDARCYYSVLFLFKLISKDYTGPHWGKLAWRPISMYILSVLLNFSSVSSRTSLHFVWCPFISYLRWKCRRANRRREASKHVSEFGNNVFFRATGRFNFVNCKFRVSAHRIYVVTKRLRSDESLSKRCYAVSTNLRCAQKTSTFSKDLCKALLSANIPLNKVDYRDFRLFKG